MVTDTLTDPRDGNTYRTVQIGDQRWLAENLKYLPSVCQGRPRRTVPAFHYVYDYQGDSVEEAKATANYRHYGVLYNWPAALEACPSGWHLPSDAEWSALTDFLIHTHKHITPSNVGYALRSRRQVGLHRWAAMATPTERPRWERVGPTSGATAGCPPSYDR